MRTDSGRFLPVLLDRPSEEARETCWGRLLALSASGARLIARAKLLRGDELFLRFELAGEDVAGLPARVLRARVDADGWSVAELEFPREEDRVRLGRLLGRVLV
jgi:hypothetical protein